MWICTYPAVWELPPRARRILACDQLAPLLAGTTSACAENTTVVPPWGGDHGNYLRVRGEYKSSSSMSARSLELPPRARRILCRYNPTPTTTGTTSACAENTPEATEVLIAVRNYLRVRGEYLRASYPGPRVLELPPRARRIPVDGGEG